MAPERNVGTLSDVCASALTVFDGFGRIHGKAPRGWSSLLRGSSGLAACSPSVPREGSLVGRWQSYVSENRTTPGLAGSTGAPLRRRPPRLDRGHHPRESVAPRVHRCDRERGERAVQHVTTTARGPLLHRPKRRGCRGSLGAGRGARGARSTAAGSVDGERPIARKPTDLSQEAFSGDAPGAIRGAAKYRRRTNMIAEPAIRT